MSPGITMPAGEPANGAESVATIKAALDAGMSFSLLLRAVGYGPDAVARERLAEALGALQREVNRCHLARIDVVAEAPTRPRRPSGPRQFPAGQRSGLSLLTRREIEVLDLVTAGMTNRSIAKWLGISERTAREHVARILLKLQVRSRVEAAVIATQWRLAG
jgi:DNA-binding NarL/FixJ family response regulator